MSIPAYIQTPYYYVNKTVDDVQDIMDDLSTKLQAIGWTSPAANTYQTPTDPWGRFFKILLVRVTATRLSMTMTDDFSIAQSVEMRISGTVIMKYYYGTRYMYAVNSTVVHSSPEYMYATLLSLNPESETSHSRYCIMGGSWWNSENRTSYQSIDFIGKFGDGTAYRNSAYGSYRLLIQGQCAGGANYATFGLSTFTDGRRWVPAWAIEANQSSEFVFYGRLYNRLLTRNTTLIGGQYAVPIDEATTGIFEVLNLGSNGNPAHNTLTAMRIQ